MMGGLWVTFEEGERIAQVENCFLERGFGGKKKAFGDFAVWRLGI